MEICGAGAADKHTPAPDAGERGLVLGESEQVFGQICGRIGGGRMSPGRYSAAADKFSAPRGVGGRRLRGWTEPRLLSARRAISAHPRASLAHYP